MQTVAARCRKTVRMAPASQTADDDATAEHNPTVHNNGRPSIIRSTTNGLMQSIAEWQNQMTDLVRTGLRSEELKHLWPDNRSAPPAVDMQASTNHTLSSNSAASHQVNEAQSSESGPAVQSTKSGVLVVGGNQSTAGEFASLAAACEAAKTGDVIELRFNGRIEERPFRLGNLNLTIRAADGYQPVVRFHPQEQLATETGRSAIIVGGGNLSLLGLAIEFDVPRDLPADDWTIFELRQPEAVRLESCVLTIRNTTASGATLHPDVTFFRVRPSSVAATPLSGEKGSRSVRTSTVALQLRNSFCAAPPHSWKRSQHFRFRCNGITAFWLRIKECSV